jgi:hypothetical protein
MNTKHNIQKQIEPLLEKHFPLLNQFWNDWLLPLTGQPYNNDWRNDTIPNLEEIGMNWFGIIKSLNYINHNKLNVRRGDPNQTYKNIYFHFSMVFDCIDSMSRNIVLLLGHLKLIDLNQLLPKTESDLLFEFKVWVETKYKSAYEQLVNDGRPIIYYPQHNDDFFNQIVPKSARKNYMSLKEDLKKYRNFFMHNPGVDIIQQGETLFTIKKEYVRLGKNWSDLKFLIHTDITKFDNPIIVVENDLTQLLFILNGEVWEHISAAMKRIYKHKDFNLIFRDYQRIIVNRN